MERELEHARDAQGVHRDGAGIGFVSEAIELGGVIVSGVIGAFDAEMGWVKASRVRKMRASCRRR